MSLREKINENPLIPIGALVVLLLGIGAYFMLLRPQNNDNVVLPAFFTTDDGETFFVDEGYPPFEANGGTAVRAYVFRDKVTGDEFVHYMSKYASEADIQKAIDSEAAGGRYTGDGPPPVVLFKLRGEDEWIGRDSAENAAKINKMRLGVMSPAGNPASSISPQ